MRLLINLLLFITAIFLTVLLFLPSVLHAIYDAIRFGSLSRRINYYFLSSAVAIDIMCNTAFSNLLNGWFLKKGGYHFGKRGETVSSALGKNQLIGGLTFLGKGLASILDLLQKDHCYISIDDEKYYIYPKAPKVEWYITAATLIITAVVLMSLYKLVNFII